MIGDLDPKLRLAAPISRGGINVASVLVGQVRPLMVTADLSEAPDDLWSRLFAQPRGGFEGFTHGPPEISGTKVVAHVGRGELVGWARELDRRIEFANRRYRRAREDRAPAIAAERAAVADAHQALVEAREQAADL